MDNSESEKLEIALGSVDLLNCESDIEDEEEEIDQEDSPRRNGLFSIIENLKYHKNQFHQGNFFFTMIIQNADG